MKFCRCVTLSIFLFLGVRFSMGYSQESWVPVTKEMLSADVYKDYPGASGELVLSDGTKIVLMVRKTKDKFEYMINRINKRGTASRLFQDSWPPGNPTPFLVVNLNSELTDIKTHKKFKIDVRKSFVFDEWAFRWAFAEDKGRWTRILLKEED